MSFKNSIGGSHGSGPINTASGKLSRATGGPVDGYAPGKGWGTGGAPEPEKGASSNSDMKPTSVSQGGGGKDGMPKPSSDRVRAGK